MGNHKYNPVAIAAAKGELPPKQKLMGKREREQYLQNLVLAKMAEKNPAFLEVYSAIKDRY